MIAFARAKSLDLSEYELCQTQGDSSDCAFACQEMVQGRGNCIFNKCYCTEKAEIGKCEDDDHESCDALCQDMSPSLIGFCMDDQSTILLLLLTVTAHVEQKGNCDVATDDLLCRYSCGPLQLQPMCVSGVCYCTDVGTGSCKTGNNGDGCKAVCEFLSKTSNGCFEGQCNCL
ncbi:hypothetical protein HMPREF1544_11240 [Mucor circinelloides 1006PhL]|uniref:Uncharacterized protein n=1 Tax=Mucor circinelloides f. circinelloides (strain 1006PhL) TaxID=1220926 RepID=S2IWH4_MUCC1|nr:hypothetical protein HMPREF1544_11240 [Mucor circinelloides 1006PhL]